MDRHETAAHRYLKGKAGVHQMTLEIEVKQLAEYLREHFPEPGRCGECRWLDKEPWTATESVHFRCREPENDKDTNAASLMMKDCSCPRFKRRADKYEELAAELLDKLDRRDYGKLCMAAFLRSRVTVRET